MIVPMTSATVTSGLADKKPTPWYDNNETKIPQATAIQPTGDLNELIKSMIPILPVAIGTKIATEIMVTPQLIPCLSITLKSLAELGSSLNSKTAIVAIINDWFFPNQETNKIPIKKSQLSNIFTPNFSVYIKKFLFNYNTKPQRSFAFIF